MQKVIQNYYNSPALSNSTLKLLIHNPLEFKFKMLGYEVDKEESKALKIGSALDCLLTSPED